MLPTKHLMPNHATHAPNPDCPIRIAGAGEQKPCRRPRYSMFHPDRQKCRKPSVVSQVAHWKLPPSDESFDAPAACLDGSNFSPVIIEHEEEASGCIERENLECESAGAIGLHCICARYGYLEYVAGHL